MKPHFHCCNGFHESTFSRRHLLKVGGLGLLGLSMRKVLAAEQVAKIAPRARSVVFLFQFGGPSHIDMFDRKPDAPDGIRGPLKSIRSNIPGLHLCEGMEEVAKVMDKVTLIRSQSATGATRSFAGPYDHTA